MPRTKSQNISLFMLFEVISTSRIPLSQHIATIADIFVPRTSVLSRAFKGGFPP
ncbi:MAG: hypothetical protein MJE68_22170 [Proteobacteria bacterium]|nr:hypothetical protein [Pseudomonadota bacterium]